MVEVLTLKVPSLDEILKPGQDGKTTVGSFCDTPFVPLGQQRLRTVELVLNMIKLRKESLLEAMGASEIFSHLI